MIDVGQAPAGARGRRQAMTLRPRSPVRAAILSAVTLTLYGFWWWWELNRELRARGEATHPWRAHHQDPARRSTGGALSRVRGGVTCRP
jgi:Domain of unknown function (DUF4234)